MVLASFVGVLFIPPLFAAFELLSKRPIRPIRRRPTQADAD